VAEVFLTGPHQSASSPAAPPATILSVASAKARKHGPAQPVTLVRHDQEITDLMSANGFVASRSDGPGIAWAMAAVRVPSLRSSEHLPAKLDVRDAEIAMTLSTKGGGP
jgi:hypothetical protein